MVWYRVHARTLPWRGVADPYKTWLSEIMLQQTRVATVIDHYLRFLERFPSLVALALAPEEDVLAQWSGLGYYRRARMLHKAAQFVIRERGGIFPSTADELRTLPGIGEYTSAAVASIAFGESVAAVDGNVERVLLRLTGRAEDPTAAARAFIRDIANNLVPGRVMDTASRSIHSRSIHGRVVKTNAAGDHNQAMMELGATICLPRSPLCLQCPVYDLCKTRGEHPTPERPRLRSREVAYLLSIRKRRTITHVLLTRRPPDVSLMPDMYELPPLSLNLAADYMTDREPILRLRHAITNTNYYVHVYTPRGPGDRSLRQAVPLAARDLLWVRTATLGELPLTGLARKILERLDVMALRPVRVLPAEEPILPPPTRTRRSAPIDWDDDPETF